MNDRRHITQTYFEDLQNRICTKLEEVDGKGRFHEDRWPHAQGGGGITRIIQEGGIFEKGGVNTSAVTTGLSPLLAERMSVDSQSIFACGISLVLHPRSPMVPTVHANFRYLELENGDFWFGGGADLTPYYLFDEDACLFHNVWKSVCDQHEPSSYSRFKKACDEYFSVKHRREARGIGGIFFDYLRGDFGMLFDFVRSCGDAFLSAYVPIVERRKNEPWGERERQWQLIRRGRYVEFNLVYDRGTLFGLETGGRIESILMSLPPLVRWEYSHTPHPGTREEKLLSVLKEPRDWIAR
jgi:coproporphyrinogen III oxidase